MTHKGCLEAARSWTRGVDSLPTKREVQGSDIERNIVVCMIRMGVGRVGPGFCVSWVRMLFRKRERVVVI